MFKTSISRKPLIRLAALAALGLALTVFWSFNPAFAAPTATIITVTTTTGQTGTNSQCALHEALVNANNDAQTWADCPAGSGNDTIVFADSLGTATVTYFEGGPGVSDADGLTIDGGGDITISGANSYQVFIVSSGALLTVENLTIANGYCTVPSCSGGGGIQNAGTVTVLDTTFSGNTAYDTNGAAIYNTGTLTVENSTFSGNQITSGPYGGGAIFSGGSLSVTNSTFSGNTAASGGGITNSGTLTVTNSTFSDNVAFGTIENYGTATLFNTIVASASLACVSAPPQCGCLQHGQ